MNSLTLKEKGFSESVSLKNLPFSSLPLNKGTVLILADCTLTGKPVSDILYIGKTKKPNKRIFGGYLAGYGGKITRKINAMLLDDGYMEKVEVSWMLTEDPKAAQEELLESFKKEHGKYPAWNNPAKKPAKKRAKNPEKAASPAKKVAKAKRSPKTAKPTKATVETQKTP
ncbi:MAG TPA: GIY-YIG nuclease family protein [Candidatus Bathyarchaeia archaeon]|nr:GIY-YIG nuclease family protein [Candidatus Bathyarchaeia archaeon]